MTSGSARRHGRPAPAGSRGHACAETPRLDREHGLHRLLDRLLRMEPDRVVRDRDVADQRPHDLEIALGLPQQQRGELALVRTRQRAAPHAWPCRPANPVHHDDAERDRRSSRSRPPVRPAAAAHPAAASSLLPTAARPLDHEEVEVAVVGCVPARVRPEQEDLRRCRASFRESAASVSIASVLSTVSRYSTARPAHYRATFDQTRKVGGAGSTWWTLPATAGNWPSRPQRFPTTRSHKGRCVPRSRSTVSPENALHPISTQARCA